MKGWFGWPVADGLVVTHQLQVERRTGKVRRPETDVLPLCHATNPNDTLCQSKSCQLKKQVAQQVKLVELEGYSELAAWHSGVRRMNEVNTCRALLVLGWVTVFGRVYHLSV